MLRSFKNYNSVLPRYSVVRECTVRGISIGAEARVSEMMDGLFVNVVRGGISSLLFYFERELSVGERSHSWYVIPIDQCLRARRLE